MPSNPTENSPVELGDRIIGDGLDINVELVGDALPVDVRVVQRERRSDHVVAVSPGEADCVVAVGRQISLAETQEANGPRPFS